MAFGDTISVQEVISSGAFIEIKPTSGDAWVIHNIYTPSTTDIEVYRTDGTNDILVYATNGSCLSYQMHVNANVYIKVKNVSGSDATIGYDGVVTQVV